MQLLDGVLVFEVVTEIQKTTLRSLSQMVREALAGVKQEVVDFKSLSQRSDEVVTAFLTKMNQSFDKLMDKEVVDGDAVFDFETLSIVEDKDLDVIVALEGMVNAGRNENLAANISFTTRLSTLFPLKRIDESNNPLDPSQVTTAFREALGPLDLDTQNTLSIYRSFNKIVLKCLNQVLEEANSILVDSGVIPAMEMEEDQGSPPQAATRQAPRSQDPISSFGTVEVESFEQGNDQAELFSMMQNLMHADSGQLPGGGNAGAMQSNTGMPVMVPGGDQPMVPAGQQQYMVPSGMVPTNPAMGAAQPGAMQPFQPQAGQTVEMVDQAKLMEILTDIQQSLSKISPQSVPGSMEDVERLDISQSLGEILQATIEDENTVTAVDRESSDVINLVTLLYEAIWQDSSVPIPIKELIGRTQITIIKVALADVEFFNNEDHPARALLNEFASAGIGWTEVEELGEDPLYQKIRELVERILAEYGDTNELFEDLFQDFRTFREKEARATQKLEQRIQNAGERQDRLDDIHELVNQKIAERVLGREIHAFADELLHGPFQKFMVMLVLKEGPSGNAWKQAINTIDVLLWSVQAHEHEGDRDRLAAVNPRLLKNLRKAFRIATVEVDEINELIDKLQQVQNDSFIEFEKESAAAELITDAADLIDSTTDVSLTDSTGDLSATEATAADDDLPDDDPNLVQVENLNVGTWVEFVGEDDNNTRCKLAAKINAIDKYIFVNRQGVKVVEKSKIGLARELQDGTVSIISDGLLFSRALESVIGNLRDSQHEQQTGSAYQPATGPN